MRGGSCDRGFDEGNAHTIGGAMCGKSALSNSAAILFAVAVEKIPCVCQLCGILHLGECHSQRYNVYANYCMKQITVGFSPF